MKQVNDKILDLLREKGNDVYLIAPDATVFEAITRMAEKRSGALLVMRDQQLVGIISERDYARKVILQGKLSKTTRVEEIMSTPVVYASPGHTISGCMNIMAEKAIRHLPILDDNQVVGVVSMRDLVRWVIAAQDQTIQQLEAYITGTYPG